MDANSDLDLWKKWKKTRSPEDLTALFRQVDPLLQKEINRRTAQAVPRSAMEAEAKKWAYRAFEDYSPEHGTKLSTHIMNKLQKLYRYNSQNQNFARIPEHVTTGIGTYQSSKSELTERFGRPPTTSELSDHLKWPEKHVIQMEKSLRQDVAATRFQGEEEYNQHNPRLEVLTLGYYSLTPEEQLVYDYTLGQHGRNKLNPGQIAKLLGISPSKVSKIRNGISTKLQNYLDHA